MNIFSYIYPQYDKEYDSTRIIDEDIDDGDALIWCDIEEAGTM